MTEEDPTYTFSTPGVYTIILNVTDAAGNWATVTVVITVVDVTSPVANAGKDQKVKVSETVILDASSSADNVGIISYEWDFGDGTTGTGKTTTHAYANSGIYVVRLTVKDAAKNTGYSTVMIAVPLPEPFPMWGLSVVVAPIAVGTFGAIIHLFKNKKEGLRTHKKIGHLH